MSKTQMKMTTQIVTPAQASKWLADAGSNRPLRKVHVARLANDIRNGRWEFSHQGIAFDSDKKLIDGFHRLNAIILAKKAIQLCIFWGVPHESISIIDTGAGRSLLDTGISLGVRDLTPRICQVTNAMFRGAISGVRTSGTGVRNTAPTRTDVLGFMMDYREAIEGAIQMLSPMQKGITAASVTAVFARASLHVNEDHLSRAAQLLLVGTSPDGKIEDGDRTILNLQRYLLTSWNLVGSSWAREKYLKTERALVAFADGVDLGKVFSCKTEQYPVDGDLQSMKTPEKSGKEGKK